MLIRSGSHLAKAGLSRSMAALALASAPCAESFNISRFVRAALPSFVPCAFAVASATNMRSAILRGSSLRDGQLNEPERTRTEG
jgi:hypothetical protein